MNALIGLSLAFCPSVFAADQPHEAQPLKPVSAVIQCKDTGVKGQTDGFAFPDAFGGVTGDKCVKLQPTARGDTYEIFVAPKIEGPYRKTGTIGLNSRRTTVDLAVSTDIGDFHPDDPAGKTAAETTIAGKLFFEVAKTGVLIVKLYPQFSHGKLSNAGLDVAFWAPNVPVRGTFGP